MGFFKRKSVAATITRCTEQFRRRKIVYIHAADVALPGFTFEGINVYADRALVCDGGVMVVAKGAFEGAAEGYIDHLVETGVGPDMVIEVDVPKGKNLYEAILSSPEAREKILWLVNSKHFRIEFFNTRNSLEEHFIEDLGLTWENVASFPSHVADQGNDKAWVRRLARSLNVEDLFPWHVIIRVPIGLRLIAALLVLTYMRGMVSDRYSFVVKLTNWASGLGQLYTRSRRKLLWFFLKNWRQVRQIIVEEDIGGHDAITHVRRYERGKLEDEWSTVQLIARTADGVEDLGRVLSTGLPRGIEKRDVAFMRHAHNHLGNALLSQARRATGVVCLDCARRRDPVEKKKELSVMQRVGRFSQNRLYAIIGRFLRRRGYTQFQTNPARLLGLELNVRVTFSDYVRQLLNQVKRLLGAKHLTCIQVKVKPASAKTFKELQVQLSDLVFSVERRQGVIPMVPRCLSSGYVYLVAFGSDYETARDIATVSAEKLGDAKLTELLRKAE